VITVRLEVRTRNFAAQRLYEHLGYVTVQRMAQYYSNGDDGYLMVKSLQKFD
jgi:ribosomal protein S18 acetylase RimI-like enzyme